MSCISSTTAVLDILLDLFFDSLQSSLESGRSLTVCLTAKKAMFFLINILNNFLAQSLNLRWTRRYWPRLSHVLQLNGGCMFVLADILPGQHQTLVLHWCCLTDVQPSFYAYCAQVSFPRISGFQAQSPTLSKSKSDAKQLAADAALTQITYSFVPEGRWDAFLKGRHSSDRAGMHLISTCVGLLMLTHKRMHNYRQTVPHGLHCVYKYMILSTVSVLLHIFSWIIWGWLTWLLGQ